MASVRPGTEPTPTDRHSGSRADRHSVSRADRRSGSRADRRSGSRADPGAGTLRIAVVGLGYGRSHVAEIEQLAAAGRAVELVAVVDPVPPAAIASLVDSPQRPAILAARHHATLADLLAEDVPDVVTLATPIHTHRALAVEALEAGAHVMLEKPPTATLAEFEELRQVVERTGRSAQIGFQARGGGAFAAARRVIADGTIGAVTGIGVVGTWSRSRGYYARARWAGRRVLDGTTVMDGVATNPLAHSLDIALGLAGAFHVEDVADVRIDSWHAHDIEADDTTSLVVTTSADIRIGAGLTLCSPSPSPEGDPSPLVTVSGAAGELRLSYTADRLEIETPDGVREQSYHRTGALANLVDHLLDGDPLFAPVAATGAFMRILEAARTGPAPRGIDPAYVTWTGEGAEARPAVAEVDAWCARVAREARTFTELGAPWTR